MPYGYHNSPPGMPTTPAAEPHGLGSHLDWIAHQVAALTQHVHEQRAEVRHMLGWMQRLSELHEKGRESAELFRAETRERLARLDERTSKASAPAAQTWSERLTETRKAATELATAAGWLVGATIAAAKAFHWISPELAERLLQLVRQAPAP